MRIFLIENNDHTREALCTFMEELGHEVISMQDGSEALRAFRQDPAPVVILNLLLVGVGSLDLLKTIKNEHPETVVIVTTSFPSLDSVVEVMRLDALDYLVKTEDLFNTITASLQRAEEQVQRNQQEQSEIAELRSKVTTLEETNSLLSHNLCDPQTGLHSPNLFEESLEAEIERGKRNNRTFSIVLIRLNPDLHIGNDDFEIQAVEGSLPSLAQTIRERLRKSDLLARYDNHTLSIILPETGREGATLVAKSISGLCVDLITSILCDQTPEQPILQIGVACFPEDGQEQTELLNKAGQCTTTTGSDSIH
jgi:diguanylate cyclase (GGDEF)-like protein